MSFPFGFLSSVILLTVIIVWVLLCAYPPFFLWPSAGIMDSTFHLLFALLYVFALTFIVIILTPVRLLFPQPSPASMSSTVGRLLLIIVSIILRFFLEPPAGPRDSNFRLLLYHILMCILTLMLIILNRAAIINSTFVLLVCAVLYFFFIIRIVLMFVFSVLLWLISLPPIIVFTVGPFLFILMAISMAGLQRPRRRVPSLRDVVAKDSSVQLLADQSKDELEAEETQTINKKRGDEVKPLMDKYLGSFSSMPHLRHLLSWLGGLVINQIPELTPVRCEHPMEDPNLPTGGGINGVGASSSANALTQSGSGGGNGENKEDAGTSLQVPSSTLRWVPRHPAEMIIGRVDTLYEILRYLSDDSVGTVLICGPAGVGKTSLLRQIDQRFRSTGTLHFDVVAWVTMSRWSTPMEVQQQIGARLGLSLFADGPDFVRERQASRLRRLLARRRFLLLVDEVRVLQPELLNEIGIPLPAAAGPGGNKSKIVHTTQAAEGTAIINEMGSLRVVHVAGLCAGDSRALFFRKGGLLQYPCISRLLPIDKCHGLPLTLIILGGVIQVYPIAVEDRKLDEGLGPISKLLLKHGACASDQLLCQILRYVYERLLSPSLLIYLLYCCVFPENHVMSVEELAEYIACEDPTIDGNYRSALIALPSVLRDLRLMGLIEKGCKAEDEGMVKLHGAVRETALEVAVGTQLVHAGQGLKVFPPSIGTTSGTAAKRISLMHNHMEELPDTERISFPHLLTLLLNNNPLTRVPSAFFLCMPKLRVLDLSWTPIEELPESIGSLHELRYLNLSHTLLRSLPQQLQSLQDLRLLNLSHTDQLCSIPRAVILKLSKLRQLNLFKTVHRWSEKVYDDRMEASLHDLKCLDKLLEVGLTITSLLSLEILGSLQNLLEATTFLSLDQIEGLTISHLSFIHGKLPFLRELWINEALQLGELKFYGKHLFSLEALSLDHLPRAKISFEGFLRLRRLHVLGCHGLVHLESVVLLHELQSLELRLCHEIEELSRPGDLEHLEIFEVTLARLEKMVLWGLPKFKSISIRPLQLPSLKYLEVYHCPLLKNLPFGATSAQELEEIRATQEWWDGLRWNNQNIKSAVHLRLKDPRRYMEELEEEMGEKYRTDFSLMGHITSAKPITNMKLEKEQKHAIHDTSSDVRSRSQEQEKEMSEEYRTSSSYTDQVTSGKPISKIKPINIASSLSETRIFILRNTCCKLLSLM